MTLYWLMYLIPAGLPTILRCMEVGTRRFGVWLFVGLFYVFIIGFRDDIGCDWSAYLEHYRVIGRLPFWMAVKQTDFAYATVNWLSAKLNLGIYGVNIVCGAIAMAGVARFSRQQPLPWLAMTVAVPYLIIVILMGYSRQGVAIGLVLWGLAVLQERRVMHYVLLTVLAALFHKTAVVMLPLALVYSGLSIKTRLLILVPLTLVAFRFLLLDSYDAYLEGYVETKMESGGGVVRVLINLSAALLFFAFIRPWRRQWDDSAIWICLAVAAMVSVPLVFISSTAVDRITLFLIPLQLVLCSRVPLFFRDVFIRSSIALFIVVTYGMVLYIWLTRSYFASLCWLPYKNVLID